MPRISVLSDVKTEICLLCNNYDVYLAILIFDLRIKRPISEIKRSLSEVRRLIWRIKDQSSKLKGLSCKLKDQYWTLNDIKVDLYRVDVCFYSVY